MTREEIKMLEATRDLWEIKKAFDSGTTNRSMLNSAFDRLMDVADKIASERDGKIIFMHEC